MKWPSIRNYLLTIACVSSLLITSAHASQAAGKGRSFFENQGDVVWEVPTNHKVVALTFDDGPNAKYTPLILDLLKEYHAKATFFVIGSRLETYPEIAKRAIEEQHELGNHSYSHIIGRLSENKLQEEIGKTQQSILRVTGQKASLFRPPGGYYSERVVNTAKKAGCLVVMWSWDLDTRDWSRPGVRKIIKKVVSNVHNGDIVLFHDHGDHCDQTLDALKLILPELQKKGYQFITVSELLQFRNSK